MEEYDGTGHLPGEIIEVYRAKGPTEVVETYCRPLPGRAEEETAQPVPVRTDGGKKHSRRGFRVFLGCVAVMVVLAIGAQLVSGLFRRPRWSEDDWYWYYDDEYDYYDPDEPYGEITIPTYPVGQGAALEVRSARGRVLTAQEVYRLVNPAVVTVLVDLGDGSASVGTGVIFSADGYFVTNYHVVAGGADCAAVLDTGAMYPARFVAGDAENDLAVLRLEGDGLLPTAAFADSDDLTVGDKVYAIGNPLGYELRGTLTDGIVSAINRDVEVDGAVRTLIQTNAALNSGNSGGPLINEYGQVVGINVIKMSSRYSTIEGLGFAIPSASMERIVNDLLTYGALQPEPTLGVSVDRDGTEVRSGLLGIRVLSVTEGSPADQAGVRQGDYIVGADGQPITSSRELLRVRGRHYAGDTMTLTLWRQGRELTVTLRFPTEETARS